jgi:hypothetical protein
MNETPDSDIIGKAKTELRDLLVIVAPNLTPMDTLSGLISQINNVLAWLRDQIPKTTNEGRALPAEPFIMRLGMNFTITPKNVIRWPKEKAAGRSALGIFEDAIAALIPPATPPAELAALRAECERLRESLAIQTRCANYWWVEFRTAMKHPPLEPRSSDSAQDAALREMIAQRQQLTAAVTRAERAEVALAFYADENRYDYDETCCADKTNPGFNSWGDGILDDRGQTAREALAAARDAKGEA